MFRKREFVSPSDAGERFGRAVYTAAQELFRELFYCGWPNEVIFDRAVLEALNGIRAASEE